MVFLPGGRLFTDTSLLTQVAEWKLKYEAIEKREAERREADAKKHKEEVAFLENHGEWAGRDPNHSWSLFFTCISIQGSVALFHCTDACNAASVTC